ncbi:hypothetical protein HYH03_017942 [Edaphochlamys debaryana]|uniref:Uncharacterized protein n=1 Tax=Edaphochlamys debaryana TaxID=47281 RepID=A0A835XGY1_9CHLO|nr:hypothetical protein HYH03_017942 [Edaphochlamys debaryana]|eukprot:KAG2483150.1 hypothetical protein HYH03_017942 [Edaphochlamys debaryana]
MATRSREKAAEELPPLIDLTFSDRETNVASRLRHAIAHWLIKGDFQWPEDSPLPSSKLVTIGSYLKKYWHGTWNEPSYNWPKLKDFLTAEEAAGVFSFAGQDKQHDICSLNPWALREAAEAAAGGGGDDEGEAGQGGDYEDEEDEDEEGGGGRGSRAPPARVMAAINAGWPGKTPLARFRRCVAAELSGMRAGPSGPHSCLSASLTSRLRSSYAPLCNAVLASDGRLHLKQLLGPGAENAPGGAFLRAVAHPNDGCFQLDLRGLLDWHAGGGQAATGSGASGTSTPPPGVAAAAAAAAGPSSGAGPSGAGSAAAGRRPGQLDTSATAARGAPGVSPTAPAAAAPGPEGGDGWMASAPLNLLGSLAFPGPAAASELRRLLVARLSQAEGANAQPGLPDLHLPWADIAPLVASSRAASQAPSLSSPAAFKAFLLHPASAACFGALRLLRSPADPASAVDCVALSAPALRRAAGLGLGAAVATAWPGGEPIQRLRRGAVRYLAGIPSSPCGPHASRGATLGSFLKQTQASAYSTVGGAGLLGRLPDDGVAGRNPLLRLERPPGGGEPHLKLALTDLLAAFPPERRGEDLGLGVPPPPPPPQQPRAAAQPGRAGAPGRSQSGGPGAGAGAGADDDFEAQLAAALRASAEEAAMAGWVVEGFNAPAPEPPAAPAARGPAAPAAPAGPPPPIAVSAPAFAPAPAQGPPMPAPSTAAALAAAAAAAAPPAGPASPSPDGGAGVLAPAPAVWVREAGEFTALLHHAYAAGQCGLAVHTGKAQRPGAAPGSPPAIVAVVAGLYVPVAAAAVEQGAAEGAAAAWPAAVYLFDCASVLGSGGAGGGGGAGAGGLPGAAEALAALLESPYVAKTVHGCETVATLAAACGAPSITPLLDTRVMLRGVAGMLPSPLPALPPPPPAFAGPLAAVATAGLNAHLGQLQSSLAASGLWADRPELLSALLSRHSACLREELFGMRDWATNPSSCEAALAAAARHLPELWEALVGEAVPWVAMAAAATATAAALAPPAPAPGAGTRTVTVVVSAAQPAAAP